MVTILLLSLVAGYAAGSVFGLFGPDDDPQVRVDEADLDQELALLDSDAADLIETAFADDPVAETELLDDDALFSIYESEDFSVIQGTEGRDFIALPGAEVSADAAFAGAGDDVVLGADGADVMFGDNGDDMLFGAGNDDQIFGDEGGDTLSGGDGGDLLVGGLGGDVLYGGAGNDTIFDGDHVANTEVHDRVDVIVAGDGDDRIYLEDGINLVSLGEGHDHVTLYTEAEDNPGAVITDFNPTEDALLIGVHAPDFVLPEGVNSAEMSYRLTEIETDIGRGTLVEPVVGDAELASTIEAASIGFAVLIGITPDQLDGTDIRVVLTNANHNINAEDGINGIADAMRASGV